MQLIPVARGRIRHVDTRRNFAIADIHVPIRATVFIPAAVIKDYSATVKPVVGMLCELADVCEVPRGWSACRVTNLKDEAT